MRHFVAREFDLFVFEEENPEKIADCVILQLDAVGGCVGHFVAFYNFDSVLLIAIACAQLQSHILAHVPLKYK